MLAHNLHAQYYNKHSHREGGNMIIIDGRQSDISTGNFANLEEILVKVMEEEILEDRIVTDVLLNNENFSEIYPHQAEDISSGDVQSLELRTASLNEMAGDVTVELYKVLRIMQSGCKRIAALFRAADLAEALEVLQDLLDVTRHFLATINLLTEKFPASKDAVLEKASSELDGLVSEMCDVMDNHDWILLADLLEYEMLPACQTWNDVLASLGDNIAVASKE